MKNTAVIMAGGKGERFWPKSRDHLPKQFLSLTNDRKTMIQLTVERLLPLVNIEDIYVVTNQNYIALVEEQLPKLPKENILAEPAARNTAPAIGFAAAIIQKKYKDAIMIVLPSDHLIKQTLLYLDVLKVAISVASEGRNLVTLGITPTYPETGYGYIRYGSSNLQRKVNNVYMVEKFVEKPDLNKAINYIESGNYLWNSGMFVWKTSSILNNFREFLPDMYKGLEHIKNSFGDLGFKKVLEEEFSKFKSVSIDYGIMEVASDIYTIPSSFGWDDVGSWLALERIFKVDEFGNSLEGNTTVVDTKDSIIVGNKKLIAAIGLEGIIVVDTDDVTLVCSKNSAQSMKLIIEELKKQNKQKYL